MRTRMQQNQVETPERQEEKEGETEEAKEEAEQAEQGDINEKGLVRRMGKIDRSENKKRAKIGKSKAKTSNLNVWTTKMAAMHHEAKIASNKVNQNGTREREASRRLGGSKNAEVEDEDIVEVEEASAKKKAAKTRPIVFEGEEELTKPTDMDAWDKMKEESMGSSMQKTFATNGSIG